MTMSGPATVYTAEQDLLIAGLTIACEKLRENVERITFEIMSTESRIATSIHDMGVSMDDAETLETMAQEAIGKTAIEPMSQKHPTIASHLESRCRFLTIIGMKALAGRGMIDPSDPDRWRCCISCTSKPCSPLSESRVPKRVSLMSLGNSVKPLEMNITRRRWHLGTWGW